MVIYSKIGTQFCLLACENTPTTFLCVFLKLASLTPSPNGTILAPRKIRAYFTT